MSLAENSFNDFFYASQVICCKTCTQTYDELGLHFFLLLMILELISYKKWIFWGILSSFK